MSLLPGQILPQTLPIGRLSKDGATVTIDKNWWLFLYNLGQQVLGNGSSPTIAEIAQLGFLKADGTDYERQIADLQTSLATLPDPAGRIATLEKRIGDLETLLFTQKVA